MIAPTVTYSLPPAALTPMGSPPVVDRSNDFLATHSTEARPAA
jgi:hypothetical protein